MPKKGNAKERANYHTVALISCARKVMLRILQARLQQYMNRELTDVQAWFRKGRGTRDQIANIRWIIKTTRVQKKSTTLLTMTKPLTVWITIDCGKFFSRWEYQTSLQACWEICIQVKRQHLEPDMEQQTTSKLGKESIKAVTLLIKLICIVHHAKRWAGWITSCNKYERNISNLRYADDTTLTAESE